MTVNEALIWLLWPLTLPYGAFALLRAFAYRQGILRQKQLDGIVISVGNLTTGGTGKTPMVMWIAQRLLAEGKSVGILTRGYRGKLLPGGPTSDEVEVMKQRLGDRAALGVGADRFARGRELAQRGVEWFVLDDGFQHLRLARNVDIVLIDATNPFGGGHLLPSGRLREPLSSLQRADAVVLPAGLAVDHPALQQKAIWRIERELVLPNLPSAPVVFCGIARPEQFFAQVRAAGITPAAEVVFRDHHAYDLDDIQALVNARIKLNAGGFLTTEKDAINLASEQHRLHPLVVGELKLTLDHPAEAVDAIMARIAERRPRS